MSIYATGLCIRIEMNVPWRSGVKIVIDKDHDFNPYFAEVCLQSVPGHIGHPDEGYEVDPYADFLPPISKNVDDDRAEVFVLRGFEKKDGQQYVSPVLVLSGEEYENISFKELFTKLIQGIEKLLAAQQVLEKHQWVIPRK